MSTNKKERFPLEFPSLWLVWVCVEAAYCGRSTEGAFHIMDTGSKEKGERVGILGIPPGHFTGCHLVS